jgi:hypothetical protein
MMYLICGGQRLAEGSPVAVVGNVVGELAGALVEELVGELMEKFSKRLREPFRGGKPDVERISMCAS